MGPADLNCGGAENVRIGYAYNGGSEHTASEAKSKKRLKQSRNRALEQTAAVQRMEGESSFVEGELKKRVQFGKKFKPFPRRKKSK